MVKDEIYEKLQRIKKVKSHFLMSYSGSLIKEKGVEVLEKYAPSLSGDELERIMMDEKRGSG